MTLRKRVYFILESLIWNLKFCAMSDTILRHLVSALAMVICLLAFFSGYVSGEHGWWWVAAGCFVIYGMVYKVIDVGGHGGHH